MLPTIFDRLSTDDRHIVTDGGAVYENDDDNTFTTYTSDEYSYRIEYPAKWIAETDPPRGMFFSAPNGGASAFVYVETETEVDISLSDYIESFFAELAADEYIASFERQPERVTTLSSGQSGTIVEYTYTDDVPCEQWCCTYCFVIAEGTGYTVGIEWAATDEFAVGATRIIDSFTLVGNMCRKSDVDDHRDAADSRPPKQRTEDNQ